MITRDMGMKKPLSLEGQTLLTLNLIYYEKHIYLNPVGKCIIYTNPSVELISSLIN